MREFARSTYIDAAKFWTIVIVFLYHCFMPYSSRWEWYIPSKEKSLLLTYTNLFFDSWFMLFLMFLAGITSRIFLKNYSVQNYLKAKLVKLLLPAIIANYLTVPPQIFLERSFKGNTEFSLLDHYLNFFQSTYMDGGFFGFHHTWFLYYLFIYSLLLCLLKNRYLSSLKSEGGWKVQLGGLFVLLTLSNYFLMPRYPLTFDILNDWYYHSQLFLFFIAGYFYSEKWKFDYRLLLIIGAALLFLLNTMAFPHWITSFLFALMRLTMIYGLFYWGRQFLTVDIPWYKHGFMLYILHPPIVYFYSSLFVNSELALAVEVLGIVFCSMLTTVMGIFVFNKVKDKVI